MLLTSPHCSTSRALRDWRRGDPFSFFHLAFVDETRTIRATLTRHNRPNRTILPDTRKPAAIGALILLPELETVVVAHLLEIDPIDQPAVEESKVLAREYLMRR